MKIDSNKFKVLRTFSLIALSLQIISASSIIISQTILIKVNLALILFPIPVYIIPSIIFIILIIIKKENFLVIKKIFPYYISLECFVIGLAGGGVRSISYLIIFAVPFLAYALEEKVLYPSLLSLIHYIFFIIIWFIPVLDKLLLKISLYPPEVLLQANFTYIFMFLVVYITVFLLALYFSKENKKYKKIIEDKKDELEIQNIKLEKINKQIEESNKQIEQEKNNKTNFFVNVAHELKTPITLIYNNFEMYMKDKKTGDLNVISINLKKMIRDFTNYLNFDSLERGYVNYNHNQIVNIKKTVKDAVLLFQESALQRDVDIKSYISNENLFIRIDPGALDNIINNLLDNAVKYTEGFRNFNLFVSVSLTAQEDKIILTIKDNGRGIAKDKLNRIFIPYYHLSHEKKNYEGIGMGLNIVKKIVDTINGEIIVDSTENEGTTFKIIFNKYTLKPGDEIADEIVSKPPAFSTIKPVKEDFYKKNMIPILIVEDKKEMLEYLKKCFADEYNVYVARSGNDALNKLKVIPIPALIISDIMMDTNDDGYMLLEELSKNDEFKNIPVIFLTAKMGHNEKLKGLSSGALDFISKPFNIENLKEKVRSTVNKVIGLKTEQNNSNYYDNIKIGLDKFGLDDKEKQIVYYLSKDFTQKEIAHKFNFSIPTLKRKLKIIYQKFGVSNKFELIDLIE